MLFSDSTMALEGPRVTEEEPIDEETMQMRKMLKTPLEDMELSVRAKNCLKAADIKTMGELVQLEIADMMKFRNFGKKSLTELENLVGRARPGVRHGPEQVSARRRLNFLVVCGWLPAV